MGIEAGGLQSGLVIGVIIVALLLADRLGGASTFALRGAQLALALTLVMLVFGATATVAGPFEPALDAFDPSQEEIAEASAEFAEHNSVTGTVHIAVAVIFVALGVAFSRKWRALAPGILLAGVLLLLTGATDAWPSTYAASIYNSPFFAWASGAAGEAGDAHKVARVVVLAASVVLLVVMIHFRWERIRGDDETEAADSGPPGP